MALELLREIKKPVFLRLHLDETHSLKFAPALDKELEGMNLPFLSIGPEEKTEKIEKIYAGYCKKLWNSYDDAIESTDRYFGEIVEMLKKTGKLENTLIIYHADHWRRHLNESTIDMVKYPLPLIVHLPGQKEESWFEEPVQFLDVAPSILSLLDQPIPEWMEGETIFGSGLNKSRKTSRPIIAMADYDFSGLEERHPPLYGIDALSLIRDNRCYIFSNETSSGSLFDIGKDPFVFHPLDDPGLLHEYHAALRDSLEAKGVLLKEDVE
jgi:arylsulfatase A-like enzyme